MLSERSQPEKATECMIPFIQNVGTDKSMETLDRALGCRGNGEWLLMGRGFFGGGENVLKLLMVAPPVNILKAVE